MFSQILGDSVIAANRPLPRTDLIPAIDHIGGRAAFDSSGRLVYAILRTAPPAYWRIGDSAYLAAIDSRRPPTGDPRMLPQKTITAVAELYHVDSAGRNRAILANDLWAVVGGTIVVLRADGRTIEKWSFDGVRLEVVKLPREPRVLSMAEKRHIVDSVRTMAEAYKARHPEEPVVTVVVDPSELPDTLPAFRGDPPVVDLEGRLWVIEHPLATKTDSTVALVIDVRTDFGHILERRMLPPRRKIGGFGNRSIYLWQSFGLLERYIVNR